MEPTWTKGGLGGGSISLAKFWLMTILALPDLDNRSLELLVT